MSTASVQVRTTSTDSESSMSSIQDLIDMGLLLQALDEYNALCEKDAKEGKISVEQLRERQHFYKTYCKHGCDSVVNKKCLTNWAVKVFKYVQQTLKRRKNRTGRTKTSSAR